MNLRNWFRSSPAKYTITRSRRDASKRTPRCRLAVEQLEDRSVPSAVSVTDIVVREGPASLGVLDPSGAATVGINGIRELTFQSNGDLLVTGWISQSVARFDWASQTYKPFIAPGSGGMTDVQGISVGPDGNVYVSSPTQNTVFRFDGTTGAPLPAAGRTGAIFVADDPNTVGVDESGGLNDTRGVTFGADGNLYVCSRNTNQILRFQGPGGSSPGAFMSVFASISDGGWPHDLSFGPDGNLYVSLINGGISTGGQINRYDGLTGSPIGTGVFVARGSGGLAQPRQFVFDPQGANLYVTHTVASGGAQVMRYQGPNGQSPGAFVEAYITAGQAGMDSMIGLALDPAGNLITGEKYSAIVKRFAPTPLAQFTVHLDTASASQVSVNYATANGTATAGSDYVQTSGTLIFAPGETTKTIAVPTLDDLIGESTETFQLNLSNAVNATIGDNQGIGTILDNETKFYVVDSTSGSPRTYEYGSGGTSEEITPESGIEANYLPAGTNTAPRGVATTAAGTTVWVVDANKTVYVYNNGGTLLGSWTPGGLNSNATLTGIATNGTDIWLVDSSSAKVYKYTGAASRLSGSQSAASSFILANGKNGNTNPKDLVTDGASLWVVNDSTTDKVFKYTVAGSLLGSWTIDAANASPTGITINPANVSDIWIVDSGTKLVYQYTAAATRTSGSQNAAATFALAAGNTNPQGIADPPVGGATIAGAGDDLLVGGSNRDILIGRTGADRIVGNAADDILIAGRTAFDANEAALSAVLAEWTSGRSYAARVGNLMDTGTGCDFASRQNGDFFLRVTDQASTTTVFDDGSADVLTGSDGNDWFFANVFGSGTKDKITDLSAAEFANDLTFIQGP